MRHHEYYLNDEMDPMGQKEYVKFLFDFWCKLIPFYSGEQLDLVGNFRGPIIKESASCFCIRQMVCTFFKGWLHPLEIRFGWAIQDSSLTLNGDFSSSILHVPFSKFSCWYVISLHVFQDDQKIRFGQQVKLVGGLSFTL